MPSKTISLKKEAYRKLKRMKGKDKSFSDVVIDLTEDLKMDFSNIIGEDVSIDWKKVKKAREKNEEDEKREKVLLRQ